MRVIRGKKVLLTGAASGIGRALALQFARERADLFLLDVDEAGLAETVSQTRSMGVDAIGVRCDVGRASQVSSSVRKLLATWGTLDILVNNAGVCYYGSTVNMPSDQWDRLLSINLNGPLQLARELLPTLLARTESHVLNVASMYGLIGTARCSVYHASKFGMVGFSEALRAEFGRSGLGVTALCPGFVRTRFFEAMPNDRADGKAPIPPARISSTPEQVAAAGIRAVYRNKGLALVGCSAYAAYYAKRLFPGLIDFANRVGRRRKIRHLATERAANQATCPRLPVAPMPTVQYEHSRAA